MASFFVGIIKKELIGNLRSPKILFGSLVSGAMILLSFHTGYQTYLTQLTDYDLSRETNREVFNRNRTYTDLVDGFQINKRPSALGIIAEGLESRAGRVARIQRDELPHFERSRSEDNPSVAFFGGLDVEFVVRVILSLFALAFSFDLIAREREDGTLKLIFSNSVPRDQVILGKVAAAALSFVVPFLLAFLTGLAYLVARGAVLSAEEWVRTILIAVIFILYILIFLMLGLLLSVVSRNARRSIFTLLIIWSFLTLVVPTCSPLLADILVDRPSSHELNYRNLFTRVEVYNDRPTERYSMFEINRWIYQEINERMQPFVTEYLNARAKSVRLDKAISRVSPSAAMTYAVTALAGTGAEQQQKADRTIWEYRRTFLDQMYEQAARNDGRVNGEQLPQISSDRQTFSEAIASASVDIMVLLIYLLGLFLAGYLSFLYRDILA